MRRSELKAELERRGDTEKGSNVDMMGRLAVALEQEAAAEEYLDDNWGKPGDCLNCGGKDYACFCEDLS